MATTQAAKIDKAPALEPDEAPKRKPKRVRQPAAPPAPAPAAREARPREVKPREVKSREVKPPAAAMDGPWLRALRVAFWVTLVAIAAATALSIRAGHAPSWRSLSVVCLQALPLLPGMALFWRALEALRRRFDTTPLALWLGLALIGAAATMLLAPGIVFAIHARTLALSEDLSGDDSLWQHLFGFAHAFSLYVSTAFRLWWPWGAALPVMVAGLFWRYHRR